MQFMICGITVNTDKESRYSLNDLHKASGSEKRHGPSYWLQNVATSELIRELADEFGDTGNPVSVVKGGKSQGTYVCKELVYAYAMWVSPKFHLHVIRTFDNLVTKEREIQEAIRARQTARLEAPMMADAIKHQRESAGKAISHYHFSNEFDLINRIALGQTSKQFRTEHGIGKDGAIRDYLTAGQIKCIEHLQRVNTSLMDIGMSYDERKAKLNQVYMLHHSRKLMAEVIKLEG